LSRHSPKGDGGDDHSSWAYVAISLFATYPDGIGLEIASPVKPVIPPLFGLAPSGVYRAFSVAGKAVSSYLAFSPLL